MLTRLARQSDFPSLIRQRVTFTYALTSGGSGPLAGPGTFTLTAMSLNDGIVITATNGLGSTPSNVMSLDTRAVPAAPVITNATVFFCDKLPDPPLYQLQFAWTQPAVDFVNVTSWQYRITNGSPPEIDTADWTSVPTGNNPDTIDLMSNGAAPSGTLTMRGNGDNGVDSNASTGVSFSFVG